ncbi:sigma factor-like helix-turn-helix DNA-binding protein [Bradyrhizobium sp. BRP56]|uniref:sigma-70 family RNA polymerase sigma factor n=1 Tax=Bradyrhizobium sp. BRP56 TaxID=2793819 RepID=UPI001CD5A362|nr:sigma factor-like helix-turn-helix DNA-binding protein [Bradyrhizobium sp. BRP56]MCA1401919.1 hypothetical protein [Bradyrhizobium sp. BRP56]
MSHLTMTEFNRDLVDHLPMMRRSILARLPRDLANRATTVDEILSDVCLLALELQASYERGCFECWLHALRQIAHVRYFDDRAKRRKRETLRADLIDGTDDDQEESVSLSERVDAVDGIALIEARAALEIIREMPGREGEVLLLAGAGYRSAEIAKALDLNAERVRKMLERSRAKLRQMLDTPAAQAA